MTDAEMWEERYLLTEVKYARLYLAVAEQGAEEFRARLARATATVDKEIADAQSRGDRITLVGGAGDRQG